MTLNRVSSDASVIDVLDHVLDKGIVVDACMRVSLLGVDLLTVDARVVVASISTYLAYANALSEAVASSRPGPVRPRVTLDEHLRRILRQLEQRRFDPLDCRRAEDRLRDEFQSARANTLGVKR